MPPDPPAGTMSDYRFRTQPTSNPSADFHPDDIRVRLARNLVTDQYGIADLANNPQSIFYGFSSFLGAGPHPQLRPRNTYGGSLFSAAEAMSTGVSALTHTKRLQLISAMSTDITRAHSPVTTGRTGNAFQIEGIRNGAQLMQERYRARIEDLREDAQLEDILWNTDSETDFWAFVVTNSRWRKALLGLVNNGNLRATWKGDDSSHFALQFLGDGNAEFVIFKQRPGSRRVSRVAGIDTLRGVQSQVKAFDLDRLVYS